MGVRQHLLSVVDRPLVRGGAAWGLFSWCMRGVVTDHRSALAKSLTRARAAKDAEMER
eukprot:COSAG02_NODE_54625_length_295_cov_0.693878_1_plen_57_part_01